MTMMKDSRKVNIQAECATMYEALLLQQRQLYDKYLVLDGDQEATNATDQLNRAQHHSSNDHPSDVVDLSRNQDPTSNPVHTPTSASSASPSPPTTWAQSGSAAILSNHIAMNGMIQSSAIQAKTILEARNHSSSDLNYETVTDADVDALDALWEQTRRQQHFEHDYHLEYWQDQHNNDSESDYERSMFGNNRSTKATKTMQIPPSILTTIAALEQCQLSSSSTAYESNLHSALVDSSILLNAPGDEAGHVHSPKHEEDNDESLLNGFFQDYPECIRQDPIVERIDADHDDNGCSIGQKFVNRNNEDVINVEGNDTDSAFNQSQPQKRPKLSFTKVQPSRPTNPYKNKALSSAPSSTAAASTSWDSYNTQRHPSHQQRYGQNNLHPNNNNQQSSNDSMNPSNGFCTARELHSGMRTDGTVSSNSSPSKQATEVSEDPPTPTNPQQANLSAGLKRKFQLPKPRKNTGSKSSSKTSSSRVSGTGSSASSTKRQPATKDVDSDDEELPEELKGCDKELVRKIENEIVDSGEQITFSDIAGLDDAKQTVMELVCWPMKRPDLFTGLRKGPNGLLLFGPPGTGKTLVGKAIAHESGATFFSISSSSLTSKWIGEGEKLVRTLFAVAAYKEPAVVFIDEIDSLLTQRKSDENEASRRIKTEFLVQLDGTGTSVQGRVLAIGATNRPQELDDAARRRFVKRLYIPLPELPDREVLLRTLLSRNSHCLSDKELAKLSRDTNGFSGADLRSLCTDAALGPIRQLGSKALEVKPQDIPPISYKHFRYALRGMNPSVAQADLDQYVEWNDTYGSKSMTTVNYDNLSDEEESEADE